MPKKGGDGFGPNQPKNIPQGDLLITGTRGRSLDSRRRISAGPGTDRSIRDRDRFPGPRILTAGMQTSTPCSTFLPLSRTMMITRKSLFLEMTKFWLIPLVFTCKDSWTSWKRAPNLTTRTSGLLFRETAGIRIRLCNLVVSGTHPWSSSFFPVDQRLLQQHNNSNNNNNNLTNLTDLVKLCPRLCKV